MSRTIEIRDIVASDWIDRAWPLLEMHKAELEGHLPDAMRLSPDRVLFAQLEATGNLFTLGAFTDDGELVGYSVTVLQQHPHYVGARMAQNDLLFLHPDYRSGKVGLSLIKATEDAAREHGATMIVWHAKPDTAFAGLLPRLGYHAEEINFTRQL